MKPKCKKEEFGFTYNHTLQHMKMHMVSWFQMFQNLWKIAKIELIILPCLDQQGAKIHFLK